jgi:transformation/transcription domain-associated protein
LLTGLVALVGKGKSATLCKHLDMAKTWVTNKQAAYPNPKKKATLMHKLVNFESRGEVLFTPYLELVYDIYTDPSFRRSEMTSRLKNSFLIGCRAKDSSLRERFIDLLDVGVSRSLFNRVTYILAVQDWVHLADQNWIYLALHLLLGAKRMEEAIKAPRFISRSMLFYLPFSLHFSDMKWTKVRNLQSRALVDVVLNSRV